MTTRQEQIMIHLLGQLQRGDEYVMPYQTTQDGIAEAVGISRAHVSIEMKRLETKGLVTYLRRHVYADGLRSKGTRKCYLLEARGVLAALDLINGTEGVVG